MHARDSTASSQLTFARIAVDDGVSARDASAASTVGREGAEHYRRQAIVKVQVGSRGIVRARDPGGKPSLPSALEGRETAGEPTQGLQEDPHG